MKLILAAALIITGRAHSVYDGDTFWIDDTKIRLWGINSPERFKPGGLEAKNALIRIIGDRPLTCEKRGKSYDRIVMRCKIVGGPDIACEMIRQGHAVDWKKYSGGYYGKDFRENCGG